MSTTAYKVTSRSWSVETKPSHYSCLTRGEAMQDYEKGILNTARVGGFLVFKTAEGALDWLANFDPEAEFEEYCLWRCECNEEVVLGLVARVWARNLSVEALAAFWAGDSDPSPTVTNLWPKGTLAYKKVTLTEQLMGLGMEAGSE